MTTPNEAGLSNESENNGYAIRIFDAARDSKYCCGYSKAQLVVEIKKALDSKDLQINKLKEEVERLKAKLPSDIPGYYVDVELPPDTEPRPATKEEVEELKKQCFGKAIPGLNLIAENQVLVSERDRYKGALEEILYHLGSGKCSANKCDGCQWETKEASQLAKEALTNESPKSKSEAKRLKIQRGDK